MNAPLTTVVPRAMAGDGRVRVLKQLERKLLWLSSWMIHHANHVRPNRDGLKVGGHQASCASSISTTTSAPVFVSSFSCAFILLSPFG